MWAYFIVMAIVSIACYAMTPTATTQVTAVTENLDIPTADVGAPIPVVFGTYIVKSANIVWYGDLGYKAVKSDGGK